MEANAAVQANHAVIPVQTIAVARVVVQNAAQLSVSHAASHVVPVVVL